MSALTVVQSYYAAFNSGNWAGMLELVSEDIQHFPNEGEVREGKELFRSFLTKMDECYKEELKDMYFYTSEASNERVAVEFVVHGTYLKGEAGLPEAKGQTYVLPASAFLTVSAGKIQTIRTYYNLSEWIELVS